MPKCSRTIGVGLCGAQDETPLATLVGDPLGNYSRCFVECLGLMEVKLMRFTIAGVYDNSVAFRYVVGIGVTWKKTNWITIGMK